MEGRLGGCVCTFLVAVALIALVAGRATADPPLRQYEHSSGFRVPIPSEWTLTEDEPFEDFTLETVLTGPHHAGFTTNIIIETDRDFTVRESNVYLRQLVDATVRDSPGTDISSEPTYRKISGHSGVVFETTDATTPPTVLQRFAFVVSDAHDRYWALLLSVHASYVNLYRSTFNQMIDGFEITIQPAAFAGVSAVGAVAAVAGVIIAIVIAIALSRRKKRAPTPLYATSPPYQPTPIVATQTCAACGTVAPSAYRFCVACGRPLLPPPPIPGPESAGPTPPDSASPPGAPPPP